jgi:hypothetical protein
VSQSYHKHMKSTDGSVLMSSMSAAVERAVSSIEPDGDNRADFSVNIQ